MASAHFFDSAYEQTKQSESGDIHAARAPDAGRRRARVAQAERDRIPAHIATGTHQNEATACAGAHDGNQRGSVDCQGESRDGEDRQDAQLEENDRQCPDWQGSDGRNEANDKACAARENEAL